MASQEMRASIDALRDRRKASAGQAPPTLAERRAGFLPHVYQLLLGTPEAAAATERLEKFLRSWVR
jgi:hypothetical protein